MKKIIDFIKNKKTDIEGTFWGFIGVSIIIIVCLFIWKIIKFVFNLIINWAFLCPICFTIIVSLIIVLIAIKNFKK